MSLPEIVSLVTASSVFAFVFSLGLKVGPADALWFVRQPRRVVISGISMFVVMPLVALAMVMLFDLRPAVELSILAVSLSPIPPFLPRKLMKAGRQAARSVSGLPVAGLVAIVVIPVGVPLLAGWLGIELGPSDGAFARIIAWTVLLPLVAGLVGHQLVPGLADRFALYVAKFAVGLLLLATLTVLATSLPAMLELVGDGTLAAFGGFILIGLAVGHALGSTYGGDQVVLALATSGRHPGVALAIATWMMPDVPSVAPAVLLYLVLGAALSAIYLRWQDKRAPAVDEGTA